MTAPAAGPAEGTSPPRPPIRQNLPALLVLLIALGALLVAATLIFLPFVIPTALALVAATTAYPLFQKVLGLVGTARRGLASAMTCLLLIIIVFIPLGWVARSLAVQVKPAVEWTTQKLDSVQKEIDESWLNQQSWFRPTWARVKAFLDSLQDERLPDQGAGGEQPADPGQPPAEPPPPPEQPPPEQPPPEQPPAEQPPAEQPRGDPPQGDPAAGPQAAPGQGPGDALIRLAGGAATTVIANAFEFSLKFLLMIFLVFFFFKDGPQILQSLKRAIPLEEKYQNRVIRTFRQVTRSIIRGSFGAAVIQGVIATIAYAVVGLPAIFWGAITTICALIPPFGTGLVTLPIALFLIADGHWGKAIVVGVTAVIIGGLDNFLRPWLMQGTFKVHPIWILLSVLGALKVFGPAGIIFGPMILALLGTFVALLVEEEKAEVAAQANAHGGR
jgi:predicted PurR-regulated permease PerM